MSVASAAWGFVWPSRQLRWQQQLNSNSVTLRRDCMREIRELYGQSFAPLVARGLADADGVVRGIAAEIVAQHHLPMAKAVVPWLSLPAAESRLLAARVLGTILEPTAVDGLIRVARDEDPRVRRAAVEALVRYSGQAATAALLVALTDTDGQVRCVAVEGLARRDEPRVRSALIAHTTDPDEQVRSRSLLALGVFGDTELAEILQIGLDDRSAIVRTSAVEALDNLPKQALTENVIARLLVLIGDEQPLPVVSRATRALLGVGAEHTAEGIYRQWSRLTREAHGRAVAELVGRTQDYADRVPSLCLRSALSINAMSCLALLGPATRNARDVIMAVDTGRFSRLSALRAMRDRLDPDAVDWIVAALDTDDVETLDAASRALRANIGAHGLAQAMDPLAQALRRLPRASPTRTEVLRAIGSTQSARAWSILDPLLTRENASKQELLAALDAARQISHPMRGARLVELLSHSDPGVRWAAARGLFESSDVQVLPSLIERLRLGSSWREPLVLAISGLVAQATDPQVLDQIVRILAEAYAPERDALIEGLARNSHPRLQFTKQDLVDHGSEADRAKLAESLAAGERERAWLRILVKDRSARVRANAVWNLGRIGMPGDEGILQTAIRDERWEPRANALVALGRFARRSQLDIRAFVCPFVADRQPSFREAALQSLRVAAQRCSGDHELRLLLEDSQYRVRRAAARLLTEVRDPRARPNDQLALRWCRAFESNSAVRHRCDGEDTAGRGSTDLSALPISARRGPASEPGYALVFVEPTRSEGAGRVELAVGLERSDGLVRYARTDRRGALFEPETLATETVLTPSIVLER